MGFVIITRNCQPNLLAFNENDRSIILNILQDYQKSLSSISLRISWILKSPDKPQKKQKILKYYQRDSTNAKNLEES